jgi:tetratricopeptide (TPR) repeat protein
MLNSNINFLEKKLTRLLTDIYGWDKITRFYVESGILNFFISYGIKISVKKGDKKSRDGGGGLKISGTDYCQMLIVAADVFKEYGFLEISRKLYTKGVKVAKLSTEKNYLARALVHRGNFFILTSRYKEAKDDFQKSTKYATLKPIKIVADYSMGVLALKSGNYQFAINKFQKVLSAFKVNFHHSIIGNTLFNIGISLLCLEKLNESQSYFKRSIDYLSNSGDMVQLVLAFYFLGSVYVRRKKYSDAIKEYDQASKLSIQISDKAIIGLLNYAKAYVSFLNKDNKLSLKYLNKAIQDFQVTKYDAPLAESLRLKGLIFKSTKEYNLYRGYIEASERLVQNNEKSSNMLISFLTHKYLKTFDE